MAGFLYFLPGAPKAASGFGSKEAREAGLGYTFGRRVTARGVTGQGPSGAAGVVCSDRDQTKPALLGYWPERQTWRPLPPERGLAWVGMYTDEHAPTPADLARGVQLDGHLVELGDGRQWLAPIARGQLESDGELAWTCCLPMRADLDEAGQWVEGRVADRYVRLWDTALAFWDAMGGAVVDDRKTFTFAGERDAATLALSANYHLWRTECALLGLWTDQAVLAVLEALIDLPTVKAWLKKKASEPPACSPTSAGAEDSIAPIAPASPTSGGSPPSPPPAATSTCTSAGECD